MFRLNNFIALAPLVLLPCVLLAGGCSDDGGGVTASGGQSGTDGTQGATMTDAGSDDDTVTGGSGGGGSASGGDSLGPDGVPLGSAGRYVILAKTAIANVPTSTVTGDLGLSPAAASYITGLDLTRAGTKWTSAQVTGDVFAADNDPPTPTDLTTAITDMEGAYTDAAGRPDPDFTNLGGGAIGGLTLVPGLYRWTTAVTIPTDVTLSGEADAVWIFQITGDLEMAAAQQMILAGGARATNVVWQVAGTVDFGSASHAEGTFMSQSGITLGTGASLNGRLFAQTSVDIAGAVVTTP